MKPDQKETFEDGEKVANEILQRLGSIKLDDLNPKSPSLKRMLGDIQKGLDEAIEHARWYKKLAESRLRG